MQTNALEYKVIRHASPTLASLKPANLFGYFYDSEELLRKEVEDVAETLREKGIRLIVLKRSGSRALIYVYRERDLHFILEQEENQEFLFSLGYLYMNDMEALKQLKRRMEEGEEFPHEIGLFLGYPLNDVKGFMRDHGEHCRFSGIWKSYENPEKAKRYFWKLTHCSEIYVRSYQNGRTLDQLTVVS